MAIREYLPRRSRVTKTRGRHAAGRQHEPVRQQSPERGPAMLHSYQTGYARVSLNPALRILIEPLEDGRPIVVTDPDALTRAIADCELERELTLAATARKLRPEGPAPADVLRDLNDMDPSPQIWT
jgi:hypothetical protein